MAKISSEAKKRYFDRVQEYKKHIDVVLAREKSVAKTLESESAGGAAHKRLMLADERLNLASNYLLLNRISLALLGVRNDAFLNDARKSCYQSIIYLEEVVSDYIDTPFSDYSENLERIEGYEDESRYYLCRKLGFTIDSVKEDFGDNSKWKWSFVELEGRLATVTKNFINFKSFVAMLDPRVDGYPMRVEFLALCKELLLRSADRYREKYELSTLRIDDFKVAIAYLHALRRVYAIIGEPDNAESIKKKSEVWTAKMNSDEQRAAAGAGKKA
ncbi:MAG: hypothetical protein EA428_03855 [Spirochaetaceae bacterium]|nr:MAG: hypothetical protein EA428_03855 [Spirochaetaceae bacterium]